MPYISYEEDSGAIVGRFTKENIAKRSSLPIIEVNQLQFNNISNDPNNYHVVENKLVALEKTFTNFNRVKALQVLKKTTARTIVEQLNINGCGYIPDSSFQQNLTLNLSIVALNEQHLTKLWCNVNSIWEFKNHDKQDLLDIALAFNTRRESESLELYKNL